jgi:hypothetical protein
MLNVFFLGGKGEPAVGFLSPCNSSQAGVYLSICLKKQQPKLYYSNPEKSQAF